MLSRDKERKTNETQVTTAEVTIELIGGQAVNTKKKKRESKQDKNQLQAHFKRYTKVHGEEMTSTWLRRGQWKYIKTKVGHRNIDIFYAVIGIRCSIILYENIACSLSIDTK